MIKNKLPKPFKIEAADIYRDGGSYGICFIDAEKTFYELFLKVLLDTVSFRRIGYKEPILKVYDSDNFGEIKETKQLSWSEGLEFVNELKMVFKGNNFKSKTRAEELFKIVDLKGKLSKDMWA